MTSRRFESFASAAMLGLLAAAHPACGAASNPDESGTGGAGTDATGGEASGDGDSNSSGGSASGGNSSGGREGAATGGSADEPGGAAGSLGEGGAGGAEGVTSSRTILDLSLEDFTALCDEAGGVVETHAHCGGLVTGPGFSYDATIDVFTEHTCAGYNTCTGFSCVLDD